MQANVHRYEILNMYIDIILENQFLFGIDNK